MIAKLLSTIIFALATCMAVDLKPQCPVYIRAQAICFSNGKLYTDQCYADQDQPGLTPRYDCGFPVDFEGCAKKCKIAVAPCPLYFAPQGYCYNNGKVYTDDCYAHKVDPTLFALFKCPSPFKSKVCSYICRYYIAHS